MSLNDLKFRHPFTCIVAGMTSSGKTIFVRRLLANWKNLIPALSSDALKCLWCFSEQQNIFKEPINNVNMTYYKGIPDIDTIDKVKPQLIVLDDLMDNLTEEVRDLFTKGSHHRNISVVFIVQNLFNQNKFMRTISLNTHYIVLMKGIRNLQQIGILGKQINNSKLVNVFKQVTKDPYSYLLIDLHPSSNDKYRARTRIFCEEISPSLRAYHSFCPIFFNIFQT